MSQSRKAELSQHFLRSPRVAGRLIGHSNIRKKDLVVEIGAGSGVITTVLAGRAQEVWAIEPDRATAEKLRANLRRYGIRNVRVIEKDFREVELPEEEYKVFANPLFHLAAEVFYWLLGLENVEGEIRWKEGEREALGMGRDEVGRAMLGARDGRSGIYNIYRRPKGIWLILQKQMALKLIPTDRHYTSQLGRKLMEGYDTRIRLPLKREDFTPPPGVETVLFEAKRREGGVLGPKV